MSTLDLSPAAAVDVVANATETAFRDLELRVAYLEAALVDAQRANARAIAGLLRDLDDGKSAPAPASGGKAPVEASVETVETEVVDPAKAAETGDKSGTGQPAEAPVRKSRHRFL